MFVLVVIVLIIDLVIAAAVVVVVVSVVAVVLLLQFVLGYYVDSSALSVHLQTFRTQLQSTLAWPRTFGRLPPLRQNNVQYHLLDEW